MSREVIRDAYLKPAIAMVLGFVAVTVYLLAYGAPDMIPSTLLAILIQSAVGLAIFWICSVVWIGFDEPFRINVMRLLAIYSISWTILLIALSLPFLCTVSVIVPAIIFTLLHKKMLDLDFPDAVLVSVITGAVWIFVFVVILT